MTVLQVIGRSSSFLAKKGVVNARRMAEEVIADALSMKRLDLYLDFERPLKDDELAAARAAVVRRGEHEPTQYIAGVVEFAGVSLKVNSDVLIPRLETEVLVEMIAKQPLAGRLFDVCTGSGAIAIALKKRFPNLEVVASDISQKALDVAKENAKMAGVEVEFIQGDLLEPFHGMCDYLVCNPPYLSDQEYEEVEKEVLWEPKRALVGGKSGLEIYRRLKLAGVVRKKAWLEIGRGQGVGVKEIFEAQGLNGRFESDWSGHDRFFFLEID